MKSRKKNKENKNIFDVNTINMVKRWNSSVQIGTPVEIYNGKIEWGEEFINGEAISPAYINFQGKAMIDVRPGGAKPLENVCVVSMSKRF